MTSVVVVRVSEKKSETKYFPIIIFSSRFHKIQAHRISFIDNVSCHDNNLMNCVVLTCILYCIMGQVCLVSIDLSDYNHSRVSKRTQHVISCFTRNILISIRRQEKEHVHACIRNLSSVAIEYFLDADIAFCNKIMRSNLCRNGFSTSLSFHPRNLIGEIENLSDVMWSDIFD